MSEFYKIQLRKDTSAQWRAINPTLAVAELGIVTDLGKFKIGDGITPFEALPFATMSVAELNTALASKQDLLIAGTNIQIIDNTINAVLDDYATIAYVDGKLVDYALKSDIPTKTSQLTNDVKFISEDNVKTVEGQSIVGSGNIEFPIDSALSETSTNAVQNKVVKEAIDNIDTATIKQDIADIKAKDVIQDSSIANLQSKTNGLDVQVENLKEANVAINGRLDVVNSNINTVNSDITDLQRTDVQHNSRITDNANANTRQDREIEALQAQDTTLDNKINGVKERVVTLEAKASQVYTNYDAIVASGDTNPNKIFVDKSGHTCYVYADGGYKQIGKDITIDTELSDTSENPVQNKVITIRLNEIGEKLLNKANIDGYYEEMRVGQADNLTAGFNVSSEGYNMITANGKEIEDGLAEVNNLSGNSIVWNQLVQNGDFSDGTNHWINYGGLSEISVTNGILKLVSKATPDSRLINQPISNIIIGHKYIGIVRYKCEDDINVFIQIAGNGTNNNVKYFGKSDTFVTEKFIFTPTDGNQSRHLYLGLSGNDINTAYFKFVQIIDLTKMFGAGNEPTLEQFEAIYNQPYYDYNAGEIINYNADGFKVVGFNLWDEQWIPFNDNGICTKNLIPVKPNTKYYCTILDGEAIFAKTFNKNKEVIKYPISISNQEFITDENTYYLYFETYGKGKYGKVYKHDICINISSPNLNGTYKPYKEQTINFNIQDIKGEDGLPLFPNGLQSAGDVHDEITPNYAIKRVETYKFHDIQSNSGYLWEFDANNHVISHYLIENIIKTKAYQGIICSRYTYCEKHSTGEFNEEAPDMSINILATIDSQPTIKLKILIKDSTITSVDDFLNKYGELEFQVSLAEPIIVNFDQPIRNTFNIENQGMIYQLPEQANGLVTSTPTIVDIRYYMNAAGIIEGLPKDYVSKKSITNLLSALGQAYGGQWSMTWNEANEEYEFHYVAPTTVQSIELPNEESTI